MLALKSCSRCGGDMSWDRDRYGAYRFCLQCGNAIDLVVPLDRAEYSFFNLPGTQLRKP